VRRGVRVVALLRLKRASKGLRNGSLGGIVEDVCVFDVFSVLNSRKTDDGCK
jgi:hypothetical protein